jgi:hypothetical protein
MPTGADDLCGDAPRATWIAQSFRNADYLVVAYSKCDANTPPAL